ncbi:helix-turn-helix domain-containing protein [Halosolutus gelatinilyticus]|uniref:helix-turn-helix domain-containing protein n=1 Tax=Halosolutus gelatinilyticus TaxID=2931975 RepID=UPI001FF6780F|nr:helix-turn-helix domain-containing protein [Halosolutus gelatinilyticus]
MFDPRSIAIQDSIQDVLADVDVTINEIGSYDRHGGTDAGALTDRQLVAVETALSIGYYAVPREASLADALDCAESTASVLLRRAERDLFARVLDRYDGAIGPVETP